MEKQKQDNVLVDKSSFERLQKGTQAVCVHVRVCMHTCGCVCMHACKLVNVREYIWVYL